MNKNAVITGASSGIGLEIAKQLASKGFNCILVARRLDKLEELKKEIESNYSVEVHTIEEDLSKSSSAKSLYKKATKIYDNIEVLVNNAGFGLNGEFLSADIEKTLQMLQLNIVTLTELSHLFGSLMASKNMGHIMQISSVGAFQPAPGFAAYAATKAYVLSFGEALDFEMRKKGISVTTVYPGATASEFAATADFKPNAMIRASMMSSEQVAKQAVSAMLKSKRKKINGLMNSLNATMVKFMPRRLATWFASKLMN